MNDMIAWIAAEAEEVVGRSEPVSGPRRREDVPKARVPTQSLLAHQFPRPHPTTDEIAQQSAPFAKDAKDGVASAVLTSASPISPLPAKDAGNGAPVDPLVPIESAEEIQDRVRTEDRERRIYRGRTVAMLRRYMRYSIETGRLPSLLGGEFFRAKVTSYTVVTFEDRVIFVHDMEKCLGRLDEFSRQLIARHILQEHDQAATGRLLQCTERTVRTYVPVVLDLLSQILVEVGLLERLDSNSKKSCQGGKSDPFPASDCEDGKYKV